LTRLDFLLAEDLLGKDLEEFIEFFNERQEEEDQRAVLNLITKDEQIDGRPRGTEFLLVKFLDTDSHGKRYLALRLISSDVVNIEIWRRSSPYNKNKPRKIERIVSWDWRENLLNAEDVLKKFAEELKLRTPRNRR
jgi:hypothetical protein